MARRAVLVVALATAVACSKKSDPPPSTCGTHAPTVTASANPASVEPGGAAVQLTATTTDADDTCLSTPEARTYRWRLESRPPTSSAVVSDPGSATPSLAPDVPGQYQLEVVVTDAAGHESAPDFVTVTATSCNLVAPAVIVPGPLSGTVWNPVTLPAPLVSDGNCRASGAVSYRWTLEARPSGSNAVLSDPTAQQPTFLPDVVGPYQLSLVVTDSAGIPSAPAFVTANVATCGTAVPVLPALAASPATPDAGDLVTLRVGGTITSGNVTCGAAGETYAYRWTILSRPPGSSAALTSETSPSPSFVADVPGGVYQVSLVVTDALGNDSAPVFLDVLTSTCGARAPVFSGGALAFLPSPPRAGLAFTATAPVAVDGNAGCPTRFATSVTAYTFSIVSKPAGASVQLEQNGSAAASITAAQGGTYGVQVVATSSAGLSSRPLVTSVPVSACGTYPPVASAFSLSQAVPAGAGTVSVADAPATGAGLAAGGAATSAAGFYAGVPVTVAATVTDADAGAACASFAIPPQPATFAWSLVRVPPGSRASLGFASGPEVAFSPDLPGPYQLSLTTTDASGNASTSTVAFSASCGASTPAIASLSGTQAGLVTTQAAPVPLAVAAPVSLGAVVVDPDAAGGGACGVAEAQPFTYAWSFAQLPAGSQASLTGAATATPSFVPDVAGSYVLSLTVADPQGHPATSLLTVTVTCDAAAPAIATVPGTNLPDFTVTQQVPGVLVAGLGAPGTVTLTRGSAPGTNRASAAGALTLPTTALFYPGFPLQVSANVPAFQTSAGCGVYAQTLTYAWSLRALPAGSAATLTGASGPTPGFVPDLPGAYELELALTDQLGRTSRTVLALDAALGKVASVGVCGRRAPIPVARVAGPIASPAVGAAPEPLGFRVLVDGSGSQSPDATPFSLDGSGGCGLVRPLTYAWSLEAVAPGSAATLTSANVANASIVLDAPGSYGLRLTVGDGTNVASTVLPVRGVEAYTSSPAATGQVFTATAIDGAGNPVVAWWDNSSGTVAAARCTAGCDTAGPTWTSLGAVDTGLGTLTFAPADEPRPVAVAVQGATTYVAYYTSTGGGTAGAHGLGSCSVGLAVHDGTSWVRRATVDTVHGGAVLLSACTAAGTTPFFNYEFGRWLSLAMTATGPVVGYYAVTGTNQTWLEYSACTTPDCTAFTPGLIDSSTGALLGRWNALAADSTGALHAAYSVDDDGFGSRGLRWATNASGAFVPASIEASGSVDVGRFASLARAPATSTTGAEAIAIAYADSTAKRAKVVRVSRSGGGWVAGAPATVLEPSGVDAGRGVVVAADPATGYLRLAYLDATNARVRVLASADGASFSTTGEIPVTTGANAPLGLSISFGSGTVLAGSRSATGPLGVFTGP